MMKAKPLLASTIQRWAFGLLSALAAVLVMVNTVKTVRESESRAGQMRDQYIKKQKQVIRSEADSLAALIDHEMEKLLEGAKTRVKVRVTSAHAMAWNLYDQHRGTRTEAEIRKIVIDALRPIRLDQEGGYYFIVDGDGSLKLPACPSNPAHIPLIDSRDARGQYVVRDMIDIAGSGGEGFYSYYWTKPGGRGDGYEKIAFVKGFSPFGWVIGTGVYLEDLEFRMQKIISQYTAALRFGPQGNGYAFVYELLDIDREGNFVTIYANPNQPGETGKLISDDAKDARGRPFRERVLEGLRERGECYVDYWFRKIGSTEASPKMSFFRLAGKGRFVVAAGIYMDDVEGQILLMQKNMDRQLWHGFFTIAAVFMAAVFTVLMLAGLLKKKLEADFQIFADGFNLAETQSLQIDRDKVRFLELDRLAGFANRMLSQKTGAQRELKEARERLTQAQKTARVGHYIFDVKEDMWVCSQEVCSIFEIKENTRKGVSGWLAIVHPDFRKEMADYLEDHVFTRHLQFDREYKIITRKTGREKWVHGLGELKFDEGGRPVEMFGTIQDISERKSMEDSLRLTQFIFDKAAVGIFQIDSAGRIVNVNEKAGSALGYTVAELSGMTVFDIDPYLTKAAFAVLWQRLAQKGHDSFESQHRHRSGRSICVEIVSNRIEFNKELFSISFVQDITGRKALEAQLQQAGKMEAIGTLAGGIAHDFNNILSGMIGYAQLAASHINTPERSARDVQQIIKGIRRASELTKQILTFSRQGEYQKQPFRMYGEIKEALKLIRSSIPSTIEIKTRLDSSKKVLADPIRIHQVIMNLCTNAYHAMRKTGGCLTVTLTETRVPSSGADRGQKMVPGDYLCLEVRDTGHGMDEKILEKAFEPYFTTKEKGDGTGLGLALVQAIVEEHDGFLEVESELDKGTCFSLFFPVVNDESPEGRPGAEPLSRLTGDESIMVVDDEDQVRDSYGEFLRDLGYRVRTVKSGTKALGLFKAAPADFDFILTDMTMPGITGEVLALEILKIRPDIPVVLCTGFSENISREKAAALGIRHYLEKPVLHEDLAALLRTILDQRDAPLDQLNLS